MVADDSLWQVQVINPFIRTTLHVPCTTCISRQSWLPLCCRSSHWIPVKVSSQSPSFEAQEAHDHISRTNRLTLTGFGCTSRQDVHWTLKVYQKGLSAVSTGWSSVTLVEIRYQYIGNMCREYFTYPTKSAVSVIDSIFVVDFCGPRRTDGMVGLILGREIAGVRVTLKAALLWARR